MKFLDDVDLNLPLEKTEIKKAEKNYKIAKSNVGISKSDYFPTIGAGVNYIQRYNSDMQYDKGTMNNSAPGFGVYLNQLIYNFGKTGANIKMNKFNMLSTEYAYLNTVCNTINNVKLKYCALLQAKAILEVQRKNVEINRSFFYLFSTSFLKVFKSSMVSIPTES